MTEAQDSTPARDEGEGAAPRDARAGRPFVGMHFKCCNVYSRIYINAEGSAYAGGCPRCGGWIRVRIGPEGTEARFFEAI